MKRFIESDDRMQGTLFPEYLEDYVAKNNPVRVVDVFVEHLDLGALGFNGAEPAITGRPSYHPSALLKLYIYGYLNRIQSSRRLEKEAQRNVELMWLLGRLTPDFKTIARFRKASAPAHAPYLHRCRQREWQGDPPGLQPVCASVPPTQLVFRCDGGHRRQQVQGGQ